MTFEDAFLSLGKTGVGQFLAHSTVAFAATEAAHIIGFAVLGGAVMALDLASLRVAFRRSSALTLARPLLPVFLIALLLVATTGIMLVAAGPLKYYTNPLFPLKLTALALGIIIHLTIYPGLNWMRVGDASRGYTAAILGAISLTLWTIVAVLGRWLGLI